MNTIKNTIMHRILDVGRTTRKNSNLERRLTKATEELGELAEAILSMTSLKNTKGKTKDDVISEAVDVAILVMDIALTMDQRILSGDVRIEKIQKIFNQKLDKWEQSLKSEEAAIIEADNREIYHGW